MDLTNKFLNITMVSGIIMIVFVMSMLVLNISNDALANESVTISPEIKNIAGAWYNGTITDAEYVRSIEPLIEDGTIKVEGYSNISMPDIPKSNRMGEFTVMTDKSSYVTDENIIISGTVPDVNDTGQIHCQINGGEYMTIVAYCGYASAVNGKWQVGILADYVYLESGDYVAQAKYRNETIYSSDFTYVSEDGEFQTFTATLDKKEYKLGDVIIISGTVPVGDNSEVVILLMTDTSIISISSTQPENNEYQYHLPTLSGYWMAGEYSIKLVQSDQEILLYFTLTD